MKLGDLITEEDQLAGWHAVGRLIEKFPNFAALDGFTLRGVQLQIAAEVCAARGRALDLEPANLRGTSARRQVVCMNIGPYGGDHPCARPTGHAGHCVTSEGREWRP